MSHREGATDTSDSVQSVQSAQTGRVIARASGKVILLGEHAVVYGVPALAVGIERGVRAWQEPQEARAQLRVIGWEIDAYADHPVNDLGRAYVEILKSTAPYRDGPAPSVTIEVDLPPGAGLGCSAAMGVAIARALHPDASVEALGEHAMAWERVFHGSPSGIDAAVSASGGCVQFERRGEEKIIEPVRSRAHLTLCIGNSGVPSSTKTMVEAVARQKERRPERVAQAFESIGALTRNARLAVEAGDRFALGRLMDLNQMLLAGLFVSTPEIEDLCARARNAGALGAKLTGAGGGGCVVALVPGAKVGERVLASWREAGFESFMTRVAGIEAKEDDNDTEPQERSALADVQRGAIG